MNQFYITTDSSADLTPEVCEQLSIKAIPMRAKIGRASVSDKITSADELSAMHAKCKAAQFTVLPPSRAEYEEFFDEIAENELKIVHISQGAAFSKAYGNAFYAAKNTMTKYYGSSIYVVDSHATAAGLSLVIDSAIAMHNAGVSAEEAFVELNRINGEIEQYIITNDLKNYNKAFPSGMGDMASKTGAFALIGVDDRGFPRILKRFAGSAAAIGAVSRRLGDKYSTAPVFAHGSDNINLLLKAVAAMRKCNSSNIKMSSVGLCNSLLFGSGAVSIAFAGTPPKSTEKAAFKPGKSTDFFVAEEE